ncbi:MAG: radical SAM protein [Ignavibacteriaceae bacterium]|jgi:putative pyruvate formate lyase activating enzyme|nr:radical SAM protein [Ignavibacteriaceae bacterium]
MKFIPSYKRLLKSGELKKRAEIAYNDLLSCTCCPLDCKVNRIAGELGICVSGHLPVVSSYTPHFGEEPVLLGTRGAGNIFFGNCNLKCVYCQNHEISQNYKSERYHQVSHDRLAEIMLELQQRDCHNIGLVSPTHFSSTILKSIYLAAEKGLNLPIIYNTNGYDSVEMLKLYDGVIDIYLPDFKYGSNEYAKKYSHIDNYFERTKEAIKEMFRQVGDKLVYNDGIVVRGLIIRHLVLPNDLSDTEKVFKFIAEELSPNIYISLMSQYYPTHKAYKDILINRTLRYSEYQKALDLLDKYGLHNGWIQEMESPANYLPNFNQDRVNPFNN